MAENILHLNKYTASTVQLTAKSINQMLSPKMQRGNCSLLITCDAIKTTS